MSVFAWGLGKNGQLGSGQKENVEIPLAISIPSKGKDKKKETCVSSRSSHRVVDVDAGGHYTAVLTDDGRVYCCGSGGHGRLGTGTDTDSDRLQFVQLLEGHNIIKVSCGIWHGAALSDKGEVFMWGYSKRHGVMGMEHQGPFAPPLLLNPLTSLQVAGVSCGNNYTLVWTTDGALLSWGCGRHGVLGHGSEEDQIHPRCVSFPTNKNDTSCEKRVTYADAGFVHAGVVTTEGFVYMMGSNTYGALGCGMKTPKKLALTPQRACFPDGIKVKEVSCSKGEHHGHTLSVTNDGVAYAWGDGYKGKLGLGDQESRFEPTAIPAEHFNGEKVEHVSAGGIHSAAVTQEGKVYTWGCGSDGRLGHPEAKGHRYLFRSDIPRVVEELLKYEHAIDVRASYYHTVAIVGRTEK